MASYQKHQSTQMVASQRVLTPLPMVRTPSLSLSLMRLVAPVQIQSISSFLLVLWFRLQNQRQMKSSTREKRVDFEYQCIGCSWISRKIF